MKKLIFIIIGWLIVLAIIFFSFYDRWILEYRKVDPVTGEPYGQMGYYTNWTIMCWTMAGATLVFAVIFIIVWKRKKRQN